MSNGVTKFRLPALTRIPSAKPPITQTVISRAEQVPVQPRSVDVPPARDIQSSMERVQPKASVGLNPGNHKDFYTSNAKQTIGVMMGAKIIGDNIARPAFRVYVEYLQGEHEPIEDFLSHAYGNDPKIYESVVELLNADTRHQRLYPLSIEGVRSGVNPTLPLVEFCKRYKTPVLAINTADLILLGTANPSLSRAVAEAVMDEFPEYKHSKIDFLLLTRDELEAAMKL